MLPRNTLEGARLELLGRLDFDVQGMFAGPCAVVYRKRMVICPDVFFKGRHPLIVVPDSDGPFQVLHPVSQQEAERLKRQYPQNGLSLVANVQIPKVETGR